MATPPFANHLVPALGPRGREVHGNTLSTQLSGNYCTRPATPPARCRRRRRLSNPEPWRATPPSQGVTARRSWGLPGREASTRPRARSPPAGKARRGRAHKLAAAGAAGGAWRCYLSASSCAASACRCPCWRSCRGSTGRDARPCATGCVASACWPNERTEG